jgi:mannose/cellobiose epimerase-like protein (N-acyl-D-glucosamine 2-epimerase family)
MNADDRYKPEWQDFEKRFRDQMRDTLEKLEGLPPAVRAKTEDQIRERYRRHEKETAELEEKEPDFHNPSTQGKHMSLVEFLHFDAGQIAKQAQEQRAKDIADQFKARDQGGSRDREREP